MGTRASLTARPSGSHPDGPGCAYHAPVAGRPASAGHARPDGACVVLIDPVHSGQPFLVTVRDMGMRPLALHTLPPHLVAVFTCGIDTQPGETLAGSDARSALAELRRRGLRVAGVVPATEPGVQLADELAAALGTPGNPAASAPARRDKIEMRRRGADAGIPQPPFLVAGGERDIGRAIERIGLPAIVKSPTGAGSHNVFLVSHPDDLGAVTIGDEDLFGAPIRHWLVERYVRGDEYAVNTFSYGGRHRILDRWRKLRPDAADYDQPYWDAVQVPEGPVAAVLDDFARRVLDAFEVSVGPCHIELKVTPAGPVLIELGARLPGAHIADAWRRRGQLDPFQETVRARIGERPAVMDQGLGLDRLLGATFIAHDGPGGRLAAITGLDAAGDLPGVESLHVNYGVGEFVPTTRDLASMAVTAIVSADSSHGLRQVQAHVRKTIALEVSA